MALHRILTLTALRFGDRFELDPASYELRSHGEPVKLGRIPMELLLLLVERRPQLVTREQIVESVWGKDVFLDTDNSINAAIRKLRQTFEDNPDEPRYIQTVIGRGYRFIAVVEDLLPATRVVDSATETLPAQNLVVAQTPRSGVRRMSILLGTSLLLVLAFVLSINSDTVRHRLMPSAAASDAGSALKPRLAVAVLGFKNLSGKPDEEWVSTALAELLSADLAAGRQLHVIPGENVSRMKLDLALPPADSYATDTLTKISKHLNSDLVVLGSYLAVGKSAGDKIRVNLKVQDARTGDTITVISQDGTEAELAELVSRSGDSVRRMLGIGSPSVDDAAQARAALPDNSKAARFYAKGLEKLRTFDTLAARDLLVQAISADPNHALSHAALSECWSELGYELKALQEAKQAFEVSSRLSRADQLSVEAKYRVAAHEFPRAIELYRMLREFFPDNPEYGLELVRVQTLAGLGNDAMETVETLSRFTARGARDPRLDLAAAKAAEQTGDFKREQQLATEAAEKGYAESAGLVVAQAKLLEAVALERLGEMTLAAAAAKEAEAAFAKVGDLRNAARSVMAFGVVLYDQGDFNRARAKLEESLLTFRILGTKRYMARALNLIGNVYYEQGRLAQAQTEYEQALTIERETSDKAAIAGQLGNIANVLDSLGRLNEARKMQDESLAAFLEVGDKRGAGSTLSNIGNLLDELGDLPGAIQSFERSMKLHQETGYKQGSGYALSGWGLVLLEQDHLSEARSKIEEALALRQQLAEQSSQAMTWLYLAQLSLEENHPAQAEKLAGDATAQFAKDKSVENESMANAALAQALLAEQKTTEARAAAEQATALSHNTTSLNAFFEAGIASALVETASGNVGEARQQLDRMIQEARSRHYVGYELRARLERGMLELKSSKEARDETSLESLRKEAIAKGYLLIARKSADRLQDSSTIARRQRN